MKKFLVFMAVVGMIIAGTGLVHATVSWQTQPVLGYDYSSATGNLQIKTSLTQLTDTNGNPAYDEDGLTPVYGPVIPHYSFSGDPLYHVGSSVSTFYINPNVWDGAHWYDPNVNVYSGSGVNLQADHTYHYTGEFSFLGNGPNPAYSFIAAENVAFTGYNFIMLTAGAGGFWPEDVGNWTYTEEWIDNVDQSSISFSRNFSVSVPEPATMLLLGFGLFGLGGLRRKMI